MNIDITELAKAMDIKEIVILFIITEIAKAILGGVKYYEQGQFSTVDLIKYFFEDLKYLVVIVTFYLFYHFIQVDVFETTYKLIGAIFIGRNALAFYRLLKIEDIDTLDEYQPDYEDAIDELDSIIVIEGSE